MEGQKISIANYLNANGYDTVYILGDIAHTKGRWAGKSFELIDWQEQIIRDLFEIIKPNGYRQFNTAYIEIPKKQGKSELAAAVALLLTCGDYEERAEVFHVQQIASKLPLYLKLLQMWLECVQL